MVFIYLIDCIDTHWRFLLFNNSYHSVCNNSMNNNYLHSNCDDTKIITASLLYNVDKNKYKYSKNNSGEHFVIIHLLITSLW